MIPRSSPEVPSEQTVRPGRVERRLVDEGEVDRRVSLPGFRVLGLFEDPHLVRLEVPYPQGRRVFADQCCGGDQAPARENPPAPKMSLSGKSNRLRGSSPFTERRNDEGP